MPGTVLSTLQALTPSPCEVVTLEARRGGGDLLRLSHPVNAESGLKPTAHTRLPAPLACHGLEPSELFDWPAT